jgi:hypothetical protein
MEPLARITVPDALQAKIVQIITTPPKQVPKSVRLPPAIGWLLPTASD